MLRPDIVFHDILVDVVRGDIDGMHVHDWLILRRTLNDLFNPRGPLFALAGFVVWRRLFPRSLISPFVCAAYAAEASWCMHDKYPVSTFFRDVVLLNPKESRLSALARERYPRLATEKLGDKRSTLRRASDFLRLRRVRTSWSSSQSWVRQATGIGSIACDFGPHPVKPQDVWFVLASKTVVGSHEHPMLAARGAQWPASQRYSPLLKVQQERRKEEAAAAAEGKSKSRPSSIVAPPASTTITTSTSTKKPGPFSALRQHRQQSQRDEMTELLNDPTVKYSGHCIAMLPLRTIWAVVAADMMASHSDFLQSIMYKVMLYGAAARVDRLVALCDPATEKKKKEK